MDSVNGREQGYGIGPEENSFSGNSKGPVPRFVWAFAGIVHGLTAAPARLVMRGIVIRLTSNVGLSAKGAAKGCRHETDRRGVVVRLLAAAALAM